MPHNFDPNQNYHLFVDNNTDPLVFIHGVGLDHEYVGILKLIL